MKIEQITDKNLIAQIKAQLHLEGIDVIVRLRTENNEPQYLLVECGDGRCFLFKSESNVKDEPTEIKTSNGELLAKTSKDNDFVFECFQDAYYIEPYEDGVNIDGFVTYDQMAKLVDYLRNDKE